MNRKLIVVPVVVAALAAGGWWWWKNDQAPVARELTLHGNIDIRQVELAFNASGRLGEVLVQEGSRVAKGEVLARLDTERLRLELNRAEAVAASNRAQLAKLKAGSRPEEIRQAAALRDAARISVDDARQVYQRQQDLVARNFVSQQQADSARNSLMAAQERLKSAD